MITTIKTEKLQKIIITIIIIKKDQIDTIKNIQTKEKVIIILIIHITLIIITITLMIILNILGMRFLKIRSKDQLLN